MKETDRSPMLSAAYEAATSLVRARREGNTGRVTILGDGRRGQRIPGAGEGDVDKQVGAGRRSKKPIESWRAFFLSPAPLNWQCLPFLTTRRGPEEASFFPKGLVFGLWNDVGPAG